jgi:hypothetical protein
MEGAALCLELTKVVEVTGYTIRGHWRSPIDGSQEESGL